MPEPFNPERFAQLRPQNPLVYLPTTPSTMLEAARLVKQAAGYGTVVVADEQTAGQGRLGRNWISEPNTGLYCSILLRFPLPPAQMPIVSLLLALAAAEAIEAQAGLAPDLRWPNDLLVNGHKIAGILPQSVDGWLIAGLGINVSQQQFSPGLRTPATSILLASGRLVPRETLLAALLHAVDEWQHRLIDHGPAPVLDAFTRRSSIVSNCRVVLDDSGRRGITAGLDENGFLLVQLNGGQLERIASGTVRPDLT